MSQPDLFYCIKVRDRKTNRQTESLVSSDIHEVQRFIASHITDRVEGWKLESGKWSQLLTI